MKDESKNNKDILDRGFEDNSEHYEEVIYHVVSRSDLADKKTHEN